MSWIIKADTKALPRIEFTVLKDGEVITRDFFFDERLDEYRPVDNPGERYTQDQMDEMIEAAETQGDNRGPEIEEDDYQISDSREGYYCLQVGTNTDFDSIIQEISDDMERNNFYPNVWYVNDHGNVSLLSIKRNNNGVATSHEVKSWV